MKNKILYDILFILISAILLTGINQLVEVDLIGRFSIIIALIAYFTGKWVKGREHGTAEKVKE